MDRFDIYVFKDGGIWYAHDDDPHGVMHKGSGKTPLDAANSLLKYLAEECSIVLGDLVAVAEPMEEGAVAFQVPRLRFRRMPPPSDN